MDRPDMLEYLFSQYKKKLEEKECELTKEAEEMFKSFVEFGRYQLKINPAIGVCVLEQGLGFKLADTGEMPLVNMPLSNSNAPGCMPVTLPPMHPAASSITGVASVPIFGGDQR